MKRLTKNRITIMHCLTSGDSDCGLAPYSVSSVHFMIYGIDFGKDTKARDRTQRNQIRRTLNELVADGLVVMSRNKREGDSERLPFWENEYQIAAMVDANYFNKEMDEIERKIAFAHNGFGAIFGLTPNGDGLSKKENKELTARVKAIIQKTHPDKPTGDVAKFKVMKKSLDMLRSMPVKK